MHALQAKLLVTLAVVVAVTVWLATTAVPAVAVGGSVGVSVTVRSTVALTVGDAADASGAQSITLLSNVDCFAQTCVVERAGTAVAALTVVPSR